jgi:hypothetical protein
VSNTLKIELLKEAREMIASGAARYLCLALNTVHYKRTGKTLLQAYTTAEGPQLYRVIEDIQGEIGKRIAYSTTLDYYVLEKMRADNPHLTPLEIDYEVKSIILDTRLKLIDDILESYQLPHKD